MASGFDYKFDSDDIRRFSSYVGITARKKGNQMEFLYCPYCSGGASRDKYTFYISLATGQFDCKRSSCMVKGNMITLSRDFGFNISDDVSAYHNVNNFNNKYKKFREAHKTYEPTDKVIDYMDSRDIPADIVRKYEITAKDDGTIVFPFKNESGELKFIKYRNPDFVKGKTKGGKEWCEADCMPILFGMNHCNPENDTLIITEGQMDSLSVAAAGIENAVSVHNGCNNFKWIPHCWDWISQFQKIIVFGDLENGKMSLLDELHKRFKAKVRHVRFEDYKDCKDANEILQNYGSDQIKLCIQNAVKMPLKQIIPLSEVEPVDIYELKKMPTGIKRLDALLYGGLPFGGVVLLSGKPGEGKSTLGSQLLLSAIDSGEICFAYSGELPNYVFKDWIDFQAAGEYTYQRNNGTYAVIDEAKEKINLWYKDRCLLYDNRILDDEEEEEKTLCELIESAILQFGASVILIDNLMTALDLENLQGQDKYDNQSRFVKKLTRIALNYNVLIILVAHKRKNNTSTNENDEVAGSGDISNLAMVTLSYQKGGKDKMLDSQRLLKVSKNRLFGKVETQGWVMNYDESCRRIYDTEEELSRRFGFGDIDGFVNADDMADIPF